MGHFDSEMFYYCMHPNVEVDMTLDIAAIVLIGLLIYLLCMPSSAYCE